jgi:hypothetical protein
VVTHSRQSRRPSRHWLRRWPSGPPTTAPAMHSVGCGP